MAESTLSLAKEDLDERIGHFLGYGASSSNWSSGQQANIDRVREAGLMRFYNAHNWVFLTPTATLSLVADDYDYDMPDDFGWIVGTFHFDDDTGYAPLNLVPEGMIRDLRAQSTSSGIPREFALVAKSNDGTTGQRYQVLLYPTPDSTYTLHYRYNVIRDALTSSQYPIGGTLHRNTMVEACLAEAEAQLNDAQGLHEARFRELVAVSIRNDKYLRPRFLGKNEDFSDNPESLYSTVRYNRYNGSLPS